MAKTTLCTCDVQIGGDVRNIKHRNEHVPVTWPEIDVLKAVHGESSVTDIKAIGTRETTSVEEFKRLAERYGRKVVVELFPGKRPQMQLIMPKGAKANSDEEFPE